MLPKKITWEEFTSKDGTYYYYLVHKHNLLVLDSELLHLCWMVEDDFNSKQQDDYGKELYKLIPYGKMLFSATWQQRVVMLAKVKGIEI